MPINMAVEEPRTGIVGGEAEGDVIAGRTDRNNISSNGIVIVVSRASSASYNGKGVLKIDLISMIDFRRIESKEKNLHREDGKDAKQSCG